MHMGALGMGVVFLGLLPVVIELAVHVQQVADGTIGQVDHVLVGE